MLLIYDRVNKYKKRPCLKQGLFYLAYLLYSQMDKHTIELSLLYPEDIFIHKYLHFQTLHPKPSAALSYFQTKPIPF